MLRVRFAPSPTGMLHVGVSRTAIFNWLLARAKGGAFVLRIEDTDQARIVPGALDNILESLRWLGLDWDEGPEVGGPHDPYVQSQRKEHYHTAAQELLANGHAYECFCSSERLKALRAQQRERKQPTRYDGRCRNLTAAERSRLHSPGQPCVVRFRIPEQGQTRFHDLVRGDIVFQHRELDDFVLLKSDGMPTYQLANVVDDHLMQITHVLRGEEWISSTPKHVLLYQAFGWEPPVFVHLPLILAPDRSKLSKRHGATALLEYRDLGFLPEAMVNFLALLGWSPGGDAEFMTVEEIVARFSLEGISAAAAVFDRDKLAWLNAQHLRRLPTGRLVAALRPFLEREGLLEERLVHDDAYCARVAQLMRERGHALAELAQASCLFFAAPQDYDARASAKWFGPPEAPELLLQTGAALAGVEPFESAQIEESVRQRALSKGIEAARMIHTLRLALTGRTVGPGLFELMAVLGREECRRRLQAAADWIRARAQA